MNRGDINFNIITILKISLEAFKLLNLQQFAIKKNEFKNSKDQKSKIVKNIEITKDLNKKNSI